MTEPFPKHLGPYATAPQNVTEALSLAASLMSDEEREELLTRIYRAAPRGILFRPKEAERILRALIPGEEHDSG